MSNIKTTRYLQFQLSNTHDEIEEVEDKIAIMKSRREFGTRLTNLKERLNYWKGRTDTLQEIWNLRSEGKLFI